MYILLLLIIAINVWLLVIIINMVIIYSVLIHSWYQIISILISFQ